MQKLCCFDNNLVNLDVINLINLERLDVSNNQLTDINPPLLSLSKLTYLDISTNNLSPRDLTSFANLTSLEYLSIGNGDSEKYITVFMIV